MFFIRRVKKRHEKGSGYRFGIWCRTYLSLRKSIEDPNSYFIVYGKTLARTVWGSAVWGLQCLSARGAFELTIVAFERGPTEKNEKSIILP